MGLLSNLFTDRLPRVTGALGTGILSPNAGPGTTIQELVYADYFQGEIGDTTRMAAMQVPAVSRARSILVSVIASFPLRAFDEAGNDVTPAWFHSTSSATPVWHRTVWTIDDILFYGASLWALERTDGEITDAARVPRERWSVDQHSGEILVDGLPVPGADVLYIPGADEGLLIKGGPSIKGARAIERAWIGRAQNPIPLIELHNTTTDQLDEDEVADLVAAWGASRTSPTGAVGYTDQGIEVRVHGTVQTDMYLEARNAGVLDLARQTNMPAALLDGSMSTASLTYSTTEGKANEFVDYSIPYYTGPLEARMSQDDVLPHGSYARFDRSSFVRLPQPTTAPATDD